MEVTSLEQLLTHSTFFGSLPPRYIELIAGCSALERFDGDTFLFRAEQPAEHFYLLRAGRVALEVAAPGRGAVAVDSAGPGEVVGVSWLFPPYRWQFDARALETVRAVSFDAACLRQKVEADPQMGYELMKLFAQLLARRMQSARVRLLDLYAGAGAGSR